MARFNLHPSDFKRVADASRKVGSCVDGFKGYVWEVTRCKAYKAQVVRNGYPVMVKVVEGDYMQVEVTTRKGLIQSNLEQQSDNSVKAICRALKVVSLYNFTRGQYNHGWWDTDITDGLIRSRPKRGTPKRLLAYLE